MSAEDTIQTLEIVSEGQVVSSASFSDLDVEFDAPLGDAEKLTHLYLRALQRNGGIIYASPVFVDLI